MVYILAITSRRKDETPLYSVTNDSGTVVGNVLFSNACQWISNLIKHDDLVVRNGDTVTALQWKLEDAAECAWDSEQTGLYNAIVKLINRA